jgi:misacylated tRNA(Ala) deacylase
MVKIEVDWERRFDHMQQHSAQHLFSAIAENKKYGVDTTTWSLGEERCNVEFVPLDSSPYHEKMTGQKMISREILQKMEDDVNHAIIDSLAMTPRQIRPGTDEWKLVENKFSPDAFPDIVRVVSIEGVDVNPCCGTHVTNTAQLQVCMLERL